MEAQVLDLLGITQALEEGCRLRAFTSGGGLRVVRIERGDELRGYGEHPSIEEALALADEDVMAGGRPYADVYGKIVPHYLTGSTTPTSALDEWLLGGHKVAVWFESGAFVCEVRGFMSIRFPNHLIEEVLASGQSTTWQNRGYTYRLTRTTLGHSPSVSGCVIGIPEGKTADGADPWMPEIVATGRASSLHDVMQQALDAAATEMSS